MNKPKRLVERIIIGSLRKLDKFCNKWLCYELKDRIGQLHFQPKEELPVLITKIELVTFDNAPPTETTGFVDLIEPSTVIPQFFTSYVRITYLVGEKIKTAITNDGRLFAEAFQVVPNSKKIAK